MDYFFVCLCCCVGGYWLHKDWGACGPSVSCQQISRLGVGNRNSLEWQVPVDEESYGGVGSSLVFFFLPFSS